MTNINLVDRITNKHRQLFPTEEVLFHTLFFIIDAFLAFQLSVFQRECENHI